MTDSAIMRGFPPPLDQQVTTANWTEPPFNRWAFLNLRRLMPTAEISRGPGPTWHLEDAPLDLSPIDFEARDGAPRTVADMLAGSFTDGFIVLKDGRVVFEHYANGMTPGTPHLLASLTKSVTGSLAGILVACGGLDPAAGVIDYIPEIAGSAYADATVRHLLDMTTAVRFVENYEEEEGDLARYIRATGFDQATENMRDFFKTLAKDGEHGKRFHYVTPNTDLLGWVIERATGTDFAELLSGEIWSPMGAEFDAYIGLDRLGAPRASSRLCATLRDLARFAQMHLDDGRAGDTQVLPSAWIRDTHDAGDPAAWSIGTFAGSLPGARYRNQWYTLGDEHRTLCGLGVYGQMLYIDPIANMVIVKLSSQPRLVDDTLWDAERRAFRAIADALT
jgi:hypothetical protein